MARRKRGKKSPITVFIIVSFLLGTLLGITIAFSLIQGKPSLELSPGEVYTRRMTIVGIDKNGHGKLATLIIELRQGSGRLGFLIPPYENEDTQKSAIVARTAAGFTTGYNLDMVDILISIENLTPDTTLTGPSASGSIALLILSVIRARENKVPNVVRQDTVISASINSIGRLEPIGWITEKYRTVSEAGTYTLFIVFEGQEGMLEDHTGIPIKGAANLEQLAEFVLW